MDTWVLGKGWIDSDGHPVKRVNNFNSPFHVDFSQLHMSLGNRSHKLSFIIQWAFGAFSWIASITILWYTFSYHFELLMNLFARSVVYWPLCSRKGDIMKNLPMVISSYKINIRNISSGCGWMTKAIFPNKIWKNWYWIAQPTAKPICYYKHIRSIFFHFA